jgi:glycosyltransferase involved in cell wall biosynthesis
MRHTLLILTLNEIEGMRAILPKIQRDWCDQILVVDGGSTDGTVEFAREQGLEVVLQARPGLRHAYIEALPYVRGDAVVCFSPDGNSIPELIPALFVKLAEGFDMVTASRYLDGAKSEDDDALTGLGNWAFTRLINLFYCARYTDAMVMYRAIRVSVFHRLDLHREETYWPERIFRTNICLMPILSIRAAKAGLRVTEIPGDEPARIGGERKLQIFRWGAAYLAQVIAEKFFWSGFEKNAMGANSGAR